MIVALVILGVVIGVTLGALGAGGSILAVPVLVHVAGLSASTATATSLVAVGSAAAVAATGHRRRIRLDVVLWFVPTGFVGAIVGAAVGKHMEDAVLLLAFSTLMLVAAYRMFAVKHAEATSLSAAARHRPGNGARMVDVVHAPSLIAPTKRGGTTTIVIGGAGAAVGFLTGLFGVGGGFVIVPALTLAVGMAMPEAIATSLLIVATNAGLALVVRGIDAVDWPMALALTIPMLAGSLIGVRVGRRVPSSVARTTFAGLLVTVAVTNALLVVT